MPNTNEQGIATNKTRFSNNNYIDISTQFVPIARGLDTATHKLDNSFDFILTSENKNSRLGANSDLFYVEYTSLIYYEIIGTNVISNTLNLQTNNPSFTNKKLNIFNPLGQLVKTIRLNNREMHRIDVSNLSNGLYYITTPNWKVEPLKFVKVN